MTIVYEDQNIIIADKPQGMCVENDARPTLVGVLSAERNIPVYPCHRIDATTGGLVLLAKTEAIQQAAFEEFRLSTHSTVTGENSRSGIIKAYRCALARCPQKQSGTLRHYLLKDDRAGTVRAYDYAKGGARLAVTEYRILKSGVAPIAEAVLHTGRTHQIRAQFAKIGCPILGDDKYGDRAINKSLHVRKLQLFAVKMEFRTGGVLAYLNGRVFTAQAKWYSGVSI
ncbi:MAG: RluA family pseudouridine synthase [Oscillospiraceae bacterium]|nr:RluA family pseudouridine synthase [Oscillospiraceae bacterium]